MKRLLAIALVVVGVVTALGFQGESADGGYRLRAIFDTAAFIVPGEDVKVAGVRVGRIDELTVTEDYKAAVEMSIEDPGFQDFREDASCRIRPQSLIGEQFVECALTQPRGAGEAIPPELPEAEDGAREMPVEQTGTNVGLDLVGNINRLPTRQRLSLIINELGAGLAGRGDELNDVIRRAAPALEQTNEVLELIADSNKVLERLAVDSDRVLAPLARERESLTRFVRTTSDVADATVARSTELAASFERLPTFLAEIQPTMDRLVAFADQGLPLASNLLAGARDINEVIARTGPFTRAATPALVRLGAVGDPGIPALRASLPIVQDLGLLGRRVRPVAKDLAEVLASVQRSDGIERILDFFYYGVQAVNGFDAQGHFLRAGLLVNTCSRYATAPAAECLSKFATPTTTTATASASSATALPEDETLANTARVLAGEDADDILSEQAQAEVEAVTEKYLRKAAPPSPVEDLLDFLMGGGE